MNVKCSRIYIGTIFILVSEAQYGTGISAVFEVQR